MWQKLWGYVRESFDTLIALVVSIVTCVAGIVGWGDDSYVLAAISTTLGILAFSLTRDRHHREALIRETHSISTNLQSILHNHATSAYFFTRRSKLENLSKRLQTVSQLDVIGPSLNTFAVTQLNVIKSIRDAGGRVRILITNPNNELLQQQMAMIFTDNKSAASHAMFIHVALDRMLPLVGTSQRGGSLEVRLIDQLPFGYLALDSDTAHGQIQVELFLIGLGSKDHNPIFTLHNDNTTDTSWYNTYHSQFEVLWRGAEVSLFH